jgi:hypothetical protein
MSGMPALALQRETRHRARELKFVTSLALRPQLLDWARRHLSPDGYGSHRHAIEQLERTLFPSVPKLPDGNAGTNRASA